MVSAIVFDFAGVIVSEGYWNWLGENIPNLPQREDFFMKLSHKVDSLQITPEELVEAIGRECGKTGQEVEAGIFAQFSLNIELLSLISSLKKNYKIGFLSNFPASWRVKLFKEFDLEKYFDVIVVSTEVGGIIKPNPEIYQILLSRLHVQPKDAVFIDDRKTNIDGAKRVGMEGIVYTSNANLITELKNLGVLL